MKIGAWLRGSRSEADGLLWRCATAGRTAFARPGSFDVRRTARTALRFSLFLLLVSGALADTVTWSNGRTWAGRVELGDQAMVRLHDGARVRAWRLDEVSEIVFSPSTQNMERAWMFKEVGKTAKEFSGDPYPTMELQATIALRGGGTAIGHLLTTVFYLTASNRTEKLVLKYKLRGQEGQTFADIVYAARIQVGAARSVVAGGGCATVTVAGAGPQAELALVSRDRMQEAGMLRTGSNTFRVVLDGGDIVPAVRTGGAIVVGWGGDATPVARGRIEQGLRDLRDFFDDRRLLGVSQEPEDQTTCHTLLLLTRSARTTLDGPNTQPWRLEVWKWRLGTETNDITAASRCVLFRGIRAPDAPLPEVRIDSGLHPIGRLMDDVTIHP